MLTKFFHALFGKRGLEAYEEVEEMGKVIIRHNGREEIIGIGWGLTFRNKYDYHDLEHYEEGELPVEASEEDLINIAKRVAYAKYGSDVQALQEKIVSDDYSPDYCDYFHVYRVWRNRTNQGNRASR